MSSRRQPPATCPRRTCLSTKTKVRYVRNAGAYMVIRHRVCLKCGAQFKTSRMELPEKYCGMDPAGVK